jgi:hypothetical protein
MSVSTDTTLNTNWIVEEPFNSLICRKACQLSRSPGFSPFDQPDIEQEFRMHLFEKAGKFDPARATRMAFVKCLIKNKAVSMSRKPSAKKRSFRRNAISLNEVIANSEGSTCALSDLLDMSAGRRHIGHQIQSGAELANLKIDLGEVNRNLPAPLKQLAALLSHVAEYPAGQVLGMSRRQTARHVHALREHYEARGLAG